MVRLPRIAILLAASLSACSNFDIGPDIGDLGLEQRPVNGPAAPTARATVAFGGAELTLWPYLGSDLAGAPNDPVNLLFTGQADPRSIRSALTRLSGDRTAFGLPGGAPFNCTWSDTPSGDVLTSWSVGAEWQGSAIQLQCGDYAPIRFHLRLFRSGSWTIGGAHFEVLIPGTTTHQVLSWELAEQLVMVDMMRTGLLDAAVPLMPSEPISFAPTFRAIPAIIFNGLPGELQAVAAGVPGPAQADVPIANDGRATIFNVAHTAELDTRPLYRRSVLTFGQVIPKPFCDAGGEYVYVEGPINLVEESQQKPDGQYTSSFRASGRLRVTPVNPLTGAPAGEPYFAEVSELHTALLGNDQQPARSDKDQTLLDAAGGRLGRLAVQLELDSRGRVSAQTRVTNCR